MRRSLKTCGSASTQSLVRGCSQQQQHPRRPEGNLQNAVTGAHKHAQSVHAAGARKHARSVHAAGAHKHSRSVHAAGCDVATAGMKEGPAQATAAPSEEPGVKGHRRASLSTRHPRAGSPCRLRGGRVVNGP